MKVCIIAFLESAACRYRWRGGFGMREYSKCMVRMSRCVNIYCETSKPMGYYKRDDMAGLLYLAAGSIWIESWPWMCHESSIVANLSHMSYARRCNSALRN
jgi:hypothetical protein